MLFSNCQSKEIYAVTRMFNSRVPNTRMFRIYARLKSGDFGRIALKEFGIDEEYDQNKRFVSNSV